MNDSFLSKVNTRDTDIFGEAGCQPVESQPLGDLLRFNGPKQTGAAQLLFSFFGQKISNRHFGVIKKKMSSSQKIISHFREKLADQVITGCGTG
jgi:hypothetical protein